MTKNFVKACLVVFATACTLQSRAEGSISLDMRGGAIVPRDDKEWSVGGSFDIGLIFWGTPNVGLWIGGGGQGWSVKEESVALDSTSWFETDGRVALAPLGASLILRGYLDQNLSLQFEGGLRYAIVDSDARVEVWEPYSPGYMVVESIALDIDNTVLALAALRLNYESDFWSLGIGGGYQWDLVKPDQKLGGQKIAEADFGAGIFFMAFTMHF